MSEKHQECSECGKPLAHRIHSPTYGTHAYREPVASPQAMRSRMTANEAIDLLNARIPLKDKKIIFETAREDAAQPAAGTTPQAERQRRVQQEIANGVCHSIDLLHGERGEDARAVAPVETPIGTCDKDLPASRFMFHRRSEGCVNFTPMVTGDSQDAPVETLVLSKRDQATFLEALSNPSEPNQALREAFANLAPSLTRLTAEQFYGEQYDQFLVVGVEPSTHSRIFRFAEAFRDKSESELREENERLHDTAIRQQEICIQWAEQWGTHDAQVAGLREEIERLRKALSEVDRARQGWINNWHTASAERNAAQRELTELRAKLAEQERAK